MYIFYKQKVETSKGKDKLCDKNNRNKTDDK